MILNKVFMSLGIILLFVLGFVSGCANGSDIGIFPEGAKVNLRSFDSCSEL